MDGIILINKEEKYTSQDVCNVIKKIFNTSKVGHCGTLDPFATGLMIIGINQGTKILRFLENSKKKYLATIKFGASTDTYDKDGKIIDMNEKSKKTFLKPGREDLIGKNVLDCHPEPARSMLADMLEHPRTNAYTIEKGGVKKLIYQTPWYENGEYKGFMELSMEIPFEMKHAVRKG